MSGDWLKVKIGADLIWKTEVCIATRLSLSGTKNLKQFEIKSSNEFKN